MTRAGRAHVVTAGMLCGLGLAATHASAQAPERSPALPFVDDVSVHVTAQPDSLTVGDRATFEVVVDAPSDLQVRFPAGNAIASRKIGVFGLEVAEPAPRDTADARATWIGRYTVGVYDVGDVVLPPWPIEVQSESLTAVVRSDSVRFFVQSVLGDSLAGADIRDLKPQRRLPVPWPWWAWALVGALVLLVVWGMLRRRLRRVETAVNLPPPRPAHDVALADLRKLESMRLPFDGKIKEHYMRLSQILRTYLETAPQFRVRALEGTTYEIIQELAGRKFKKDVIDMLRELCEEADLVKFAKHQPAVDACNASLERTRHFVLDTSKEAALLDLQLPEPVPAGAAADASTSPTRSVAGNGAGSASAPGSSREGGEGR